MDKFMNKWLKQPNKNSMNESESSHSEQETKIQKTPQNLLGDSSYTNPRTDPTNSNAICTSMTFALEPSQPRPDVNFVTNSDATCTSKALESRPENVEEEHPSILSPGDEENSFSEPPKKVRKIKRQYVFRDEWLIRSEFKQWLKRKENMAYCKLCHSKIFPHRHDLDRHNKSEKHQQQIKQINLSHNITKMFSDHNLSEAVKTAEIKLSALLATNNLPFQLMDTLSDLCYNIFPDSNIAKDLKLKRTKATSVLKNVISKNIQEDLFGKFQNKGVYFSVIMDETTDVSSVKQCAFTIIYYSEDNRVTTKFFDMVELPKSDSDGLYMALKQSLKLRDIPLSNLVGFASDTTNVMIGDYNSVFSHLKRDIPDIVCVKCSCHMMHLCASKACLSLPHSVEDMLRNIGAHFSRSYCRQERFREFQIFFKTDIHKILSPSITRWLSLEECTKRILEQYEPLKAYFREIVFEDPSKTTQDILTSLENSFTKIYLEFLTYILEILNNFNKLFQSETPLLHRVKPEVIRILKIIYSNFINLQSLKEINPLDFNHENPRNFVILTNIYLGVTAHESIQEIKLTCQKEDLNNFFISCLNFYLKLASEIKKRFVFTDSIYDLISLVDPTQSLKVPSLLPVLKRFQFLNESIKPQILDNEWRDYALLDRNDLDLDPNLSPEVYWNKVFELKTSTGDPLFPNLKTVIGLLLILPFSNVSVERIFSNLKLIKTDHRNRLKTDTVSALLYTKEEVIRQGGCVKFCPSQKMLKTNIWNNI